MLVSGFRLSHIGIKMKNIILLGFDAAGNVLTPKCSRSMTEEEILEGFSGVENIVGIDYADLSVMRKPVRLVNGVITDAPPPSAAEIGLGIKEVLLSYAKRKGLQHGMMVADPDTGEWLGNPDAKPEAMRDRADDVRTRAAKMKKGTDIDKKAKALAAFNAEDDIRIEIYDIAKDLQTNTIKSMTEDDIENAQAVIDQRIKSVVIPVGIKPI